MSSSVRPKFDPQLFYEPIFDDQSIFASIEKQNQEIIQLINANEFQFSVSSVKAKRLADFVKKFKATKFFLICFQIKPDTKGKGKSAKQVIDMKVGPNYLNKIETMCIVLGDKTIYRFDNKAIVEFIDHLNRHGFEFENEHVVGICFDAKHAYKILSSCFEFGKENLAKIIWHDPMVAYWLLDPDEKEPVNLLYIAEDFLQEQLNDVQRFLKEANQLMQDQPEAGYSIFFRTILLYPVMARLRALLRERNLFDSYANIEMPALLLFGEMELTGLSVDVLNLRRSKTNWDALIRKLTLKLKARNGGDEINPRAPGQMRTLLDKNGLYDRYFEVFPLPEGVSKESVKTDRGTLERVIYAFLTFC